MMVSYLLLFVVMLIRNLILCTKSNEMNESGYSRYSHIQTTTLKTKTAAAAASHLKKKIVKNTYIQLN